MLYYLHRLYSLFFLFFFFNDTATTEIYTLSLHDALPILDERRGRVRVGGADDLEDDPALSRQPEAPGVERGVERERSDIFSNHYQQSDAVYPVRARLSTMTRRAGAWCRVPLDYPPQEDRSNGPALWAPDPRSPAEQPQEHLARDSTRPAHGRDRCVRLREVVAGVRHALRRGAVAVHRVAVHLRAHVPRPGGPPRRRRDRADPARRRPRAEESGADGALDGRDRHRGLRL